MASSGMRIVLASQLSVDVEQTQRIAKIDLEHMGDSSPGTYN